MVTITGSGSNVGTALFGTQNANNSPSAEQNAPSDKETEKAEAKAADGSATSGASPAAAPDQQDGTTAEQGAAQPGTATSASAGSGTTTRQSNSAANAAAPSELSRPRTAETDAKSAALDASRLAAERVRDTLMREALMSSIVVAPSGSSLIKPVEQATPERASNAYVANGRETSASGGDAANSRSGMVL